MVYGPYFKVLALEWAPKILIIGATVITDHEDQHVA